MIRHLIHRWEYWSTRRRVLRVVYDRTPLWFICCFGFSLGVAIMGLGELLLVLS